MPLIKILLLTITLSICNHLKARQLSIKHLVGSNKAGLINSQGKPVGKQNYIQIGNFASHGFYLAIDKNLEIELLDSQTGKVKLKGKGLKLAISPGFYNPPRYKPNGQLTSSYTADYLILSKNGRVSLYDFGLNKISEHDFDEIRVNERKTDFVLVRNGFNWGVMNKKGEVTIPPQYSSIVWGTFTEDNGIFYPNENLFSVFPRKGENFYVNSRNELDYPASSERCCQVKGETDFVDRRAFLLTGREQLKGQAKVLLARTYFTEYDSINNLAEAYKWFMEAWKEEPNMYTTLELARFLRDKRSKEVADPAFNWLDLYRAAALKSPLYYCDIARHFYYSSNTDSAEYYYKTAVEKAGSNDYTQVPANAGLAKIYQLRGKKEQAAKYLTEAMRAARVNNVQVYEHELTDLQAQLASNLHYGQVVLYNGQKAMVLHPTIGGISLSNGSIMPLSETNFKILNESPDQFMTKCLACAGTGQVSKTYRTGYTPSYSVSEVRTGSSISGDYIKTTTYTAPSTYEGTEICRQCYGKRKVVKKHP